MTSVSYLDLHRRFSPRIEAETEAALDRLGPSADGVRTAVATLLRHQTFKYPLSVLPLLVHGAEAGDPEPAVPLATVHTLWWTSACYLDDLADGNGTAAGGRIGPEEAILASVVGGHLLPLRIVRSLPVPAPVRSALADEIVTCGILAAEGQLKDLQGTAGSATRDSVLAADQGKSSAPFGMITAMAAILAGAEDGRTERWREFGSVFGILWQLFNDQEDLLSGRNEDLRNGTVTYLLACALEEAPVGREHVLSLHTAARCSEQARAELTAVLSAPAVLRRFHEDLDGFRARAHRILDGLGGHEEHLPVLRQLVDMAGRMLLPPQAAPAEARGRSA
ncbi:polyprenyl synthetase family protein [Streptomyces macrosporus]|uniref:Polyprenyl synthetase n=1 Tax=Streptomyces macrosporus TaxID=44032 RepID=A0ABP5X9T7_9ACTN